MMTTDEAIDKFVTRARTKKSQDKKYVEYIPIEEALLIADVLDRL